MLRLIALTAAIAVSLLAVSGAGGTGAQTPTRGGTVAIFARGANEPPCLNFLVSPCAEINLPLHAVLDGAYSSGPRFTFRPELVSHVDYTRTPPFTFTYHIRSEARWSDGVPVTARDFVFTHKAIRKYSPPDWDNGHRTRVRSVRALDAKTLVVVLRSRFAFWRQLFSVVLPQHALRGEDLARVWLDRIDNPKTGKPIGTGPFLVERWERGKQLTLVRNPRYWRRPAYLERIVIRFAEDVGGISDGEQIADLFRKGAVDIVDQPLGFSDLVPRLRAVPGIGLRFPLSTEWEHLEIRSGTGGHPALASKVVRRALAFAVDRVALVRVLFGETAARQKPLDSAVFLSTSRSYRPNWNGYRQRPGDVHRLLEQAGCRRGSDGIYACAGRKLSLRFISRGAPPRRVQTLELVHAQLRQVGIEVVPSYVSPSAHNQILANGDFDVTLFAWTSGAESGDDELYGCGGAQNYTGYCQRLVTRDLSQANRILDSGQRARVLNRADAQLAQDVPVIPLFQVPEVFAVRSTIRNVVFHPTDLTWNAENWWLER